MKRRVAAVLSTAALLVAGSALPAGAASRPVTVSSIARKAPDSALKVTPNPLVVTRHGGRLAVRISVSQFLAAAYATITDPARHSSVVQLHLSGYEYYGTWTGAIRLPGAARPGTWKVTTGLVTYGARAAGPHGWFTVHQTIMASLGASPRTVKAGRTVTLSGHASAWSTGGRVVGLAGRRVAFTYRTKAAGARWVRLGSAWTDRNGNFRFSFVIIRSGSIRATVAGGGLFAGVTTSNVAITVR